MSMPSGKKAEKSSDQPGSLPVFFWAITKSRKRSGQQMLLFRCRLLGHSGRTQQFLFLFKSAPHNFFLQKHDEALIKPVCNRREIGVNKLIVC